MNIMFRWWKAVFNLAFWLPEKYLEVYEARSKRKAEWKWK